MRNRKEAKRCSSEGCTNRVVKGGVCVKHGAKVEAKRCSSEGCTNHVVKGGVCVKHGAKVEAKRCSSEGCTNVARKGGVCWRHGAKVEAKRCSSEGCTNHVVKGGVCVKHGAKVKLCSSEGCTNQAQKGGVCKKHGAKVKLCGSGRFDLSFRPRRNSHDDVRSRNAAVRAGVNYSEGKLWLAFSSVAAVAYNMLLNVQDDNEDNDTIRNKTKCDFNSDYSASPVQRTSRKEDPSLSPISLQSSSLLHRYSEDTEVKVVSREQPAVVIIGSNDKIPNEDRMKDRRDELQRFVI
eukprot:scaffold17643_cov67-Skeletonema_marinoi.AAC.1